MAKQFFSNNSMMSYDEYLKFKRGNEEIKKNILDKNYYIKSFIDYKSFLTLTMAFYKQINNKSELTAPRSILDAETSYFCYRLFNDHINKCNYCSNCKNISHVYYCKNIQNILYPRGKAITKRDYLENMRYPTTLRLNKYCCKKCNKQNCSCDKRCPLPVCNNHFNSCVISPPCNNGRNTCCSDFSPCSNRYNCNPCCKKYQECNCKKEDSCSCKKEDSCSCKKQDSCSCKKEDSCSCKKQDSCGCKKHDSCSCKKQDSCSCKK